MKNRSIRLLAVLALICVALIGLACAAQAEDDEKFEKEFRWFSSAAEPSVSNDEELDMGGSCTVTIKVKNLSTRGEGSVMLEVFEEATTETVLSTDPIFAGEEQEYQVPMKKGMYHLYIYADASYLVTVSGEYTPQLSAAKLVLVKGAQRTVKVSYTAGASAKWSTGDPDVATVNQSGVITGRGTGATDISCKVGKRTLRVKVFVAGLNEKKATLKAGASKTFKVNFAGGAKLKWSSSNKKVATVNSNGVVKAVGAGKATISVRLNGNSNGEGNAQAVQLQRCHFQGENRYPEIDGRRKGQGVLEFFQQKGGHRQFKGRGQGRRHRYLHHYLQGQRRDAEMQGDGVDQAEPVQQGEAG